MPALLALLGLCLPVVTLGYIAAVRGVPVGDLQPVPPRRQEPHLPRLQRHRHAPPPRLAGLHLPAPPVPGRHPMNPTGPVSAPAAGSGRRCDALVPGQVIPGEGRASSAARPTSAPRRQLCPTCHAERPMTSTARPVVLDWRHPRIGPWSYARCRAPGPARILRACTRAAPRNNSPTGHVTATPATGHPARRENAHDDLWPASLSRRLHAPRVAGTSSRCAPGASGLRSPITMLSTALGVTPAAGAVTRAGNRGPPPMKTASAAHGPAPPTASALPPARPG